MTVFCTRTDSHVPADLADLDVRRHRLPKGAGPEREAAVAAAAGAIAEEISADGFDLVHERYSLFSDVAARLADPAHGPAIPSILEVNAPLVEEQRAHRSLHDEAGAREATRRQLRAARLVSCVSPQVARWARDEGAAASRVVVTPNGVNTARITPRPDGERRVTNSPVTVGFVGTLKPWHGTHLLLHALAAAREDLGLEVIDRPRARGPRPPRRRARHRRARPPHGAVAPDEVPRVLHRLDIAAAPYPAGDHYFSPLKVYEYLAAGLPVVASAIGTIPQMLGGGELGVLVPAGDVAALAEALDALAADPQRRARLGRAAREAAVAEHDWRRRCRDLLEQVEVAA